MPRAFAALLSIVALAAVESGCTGNSDSSSSRPPNIIVIVMDTTRQDRLSSYGYGRETSPNLTRLLASSRIFRNAYSTSGWTSPAHASLFTGLYAVAHQTTQEDWTMRPELTTLAEILGENGYETLAVVANPMLSRERGFDQGFQTYVELWRKPRAAGKTVDMEGAEVVATQLSSRERKSPLFLFVNLIGPHSPYTSCGKFCDRYVSDPSIKASEAEVIDFYLRERRYSAEELRHLNELYDAEILQVDELVGDIVESLKSTGHWENAFAVITSDHGENIGDHGHLGHVFTLYGSTVRIPLIIHYPRLFPPGSEDRMPAQLHDLFTTALRVAGIDPQPYAPQGVDLTGEMTRRERPMLMEYYRPVQAIGTVLPRLSGEKRDLLARYDRRLRAIVKANWKLIWGSDATMELYDLDADPEERNNLNQGSERPAKAVELEAGLLSLVEAYGRGARPPREKVTLDERTKQALESLGYLQ